ncbi:MAG: hypothetical protein LC744_07040 [Chloroflexi bacterium]|nr:hypothetical protein [Chloroflexota bacterium]
MRHAIPDSTAARLNLVGMLAAAVGIAILFFTIDFPVPVPIGTILLLLAAGLVAFGGWRWTTIPAIAVPLFIFVGGFLAGGLLDRMADPAQLGEFAGTWVQMLGLIIALPAGIVAAVHAYRPAA